MKCPFCGANDSKVIDSRPAEEGATIRRRWECLSCKKRFTTYEIIERMPLVVIKRDNSRQSFDRVKLINGMVRACEKRPITLSQLEEIADEIEQELQSHLEESMVIQDIATEYGYDLSLYQPGNEGMVIGDFGEKARLLFEQERISEGHYVELLNLLK